jgi:hypothetical protein
MYSGLKPARIDISTFYMNDDFTGNTVESSVWSLTTAGSGSSIVKQSALGGQIRLTSGAASGREAQITHGAVRNFALAKNPIMRGRIRLNTLTNVLFNFGFIDTATYANWALIALDTDVSSNWRTRTRLDPNSTSTDTGVAGSSGWLEMEIYGFSSEVIFVLGGAVIAVHTTNLPTVNMTPYIYIQSLNSSTHTVDVDWLELLGVRA